MSAPLPYFGYGSNLWLEQMQHRCRTSKLIGVSKLNGWKWIINSRGYATIVPSERDFVYGLLFEMTRRDYELLDMFEGSAYVRQELRDSSGRRILTYIDLNTTPGLPDIKYIFRLYRGLGDGVVQGIPPDYFAKNLHPFLIGPGSSNTASAVDDSNEQLNLANED